MILSAFPFFNELDLLEYRLRTMAPVVDLFVLMESPVTFSGLPKPLYYAENAARFAKYRIHHLVVQERPGDQLWHREHYQRECLRREVERLKPEIAIFSDTDEIVRPEIVRRFKRRHSERMMRLKLDMLLFFLDRKDSQEWIQGCIMRWRAGMQPELRAGRSTILDNAGWHMEYMGGSDILMAKALATSHGPEEGGRDFRERLAVGELPGIERTSPYPFDRLPKPMKDDHELLRKKGWFHP